MESQQTVMLTPTEMVLILAALDMLIASGSLKKAAARRLRQYIECLWNNPKIGVNLIRDN